jgi:hypothetical protein
MSSPAFETITRLAAAARERGSLRALGGTTLAETATTAGVSAAKKKKKKGKDCKKKEKQRCNNDAAACKPTLAAICGLTPAECFAAQLCCNECSADRFLTCLLAVTAP